MCGLVGVAGKIFTAEKEAFKWLHYFDIKRGEHSTGMAIVGDKGDTKVLKEVGYTTKLWEKYPDEFTLSHLYKSTDCKVLMGHNRYATTGAKTADNAHPFKHGKITGAHNGTLSAWWLDKLDGNKLFDVDSEAIFYSLNKNGFEKTMATLHGAWALTWWDEYTSTLNFIRNEERTLFYQWDKSGTTMFWASESWMLMAALSLAKIDTGDQKIHAFTANRLYEIAFPEKTWNINVKDDFTYSGETYKGFQPPVSKNSHHSSNSYWQEWANEQNWDGDYSSSVHSMAKNSNVGGKPIVAYSDTSRIEADFKKALALCNQEVTFNIYGSRMSKNAGEYFIAGCDKLPDTYEIRLYAKDSPRFAEWMEMVNSYKGTIRGQPQSQWNKDTNKMERYLLMDLRTVGEALIKKGEKVENLPNPIVPKLVVDNTKKKEVPTIILPKDLKWDLKAKYEGYQGKFITFTEYIKAINQGCICCGEKPTPLEKENIVFTQEGRVLCSICSNDVHNLRYYKVV